MKRITAFTVLIILAGLTARLFRSGTFEKERYWGEPMEEDVAGRQLWFKKMLADPATGEIPAGIRERELSFASTLPKAQALGKNFGWWVQQGPWNIGGRTRAIAFDVRNENYIVAGAATGGMWYSYDAGEFWNMATDSPELINVTSIAQDTRKGKEDNWYAGTGELYGGSLPGAFNNGNGIFKSTDGAKSWKRVGNITVAPGGVSGDWSVIHRVVTNPAIDSLDVVFVANFSSIYRSNDGGKTWSKRRGTLSSGYSYFTDVAVTKSGVVYATLSSGGGHAGIWRSMDNGGTWTNITPSFFSGATGRVSIGIAPSDEKQVYFLAHTPGTGKQSHFFDGREEWNSLWKYTYVSGNGNGTGGVWEDRSANLPAFGGAFGDFISQSGYCLEVDVKPDNAEVVFIGGTNLYRSTDGFQTRNNTTWVGGYGMNAPPPPNYTSYANQHPDQHGVIFYPSNPNKAISTHDGGISRSNNIMATEISWESLNYGYLTTQFYTIAIDHASSNSIIIGGLQDNSTLYTNSGDVRATWKMPGTGDGSYCFVKPGSSEFYMSSQQGRIARMILDTDGNLLQFARLDPLGVSKDKYQFINPYTPDARNWKQIFTPAGNIIWRNHDVTGIPLRSSRDSIASLINWTKMNNTLLPDTTDEITSIYSSALQQDVLYYGTIKGNLYRLNHASSDTSQPLSIKGLNFPGAYLHCIAQHPSDSQILFAVFTNYSVLSVFQTTNGGANWQAISGNLEENANGGGNGPSCRWLTIADVNGSLVYYLGTSTGLFATTTLNGMSTQWIRQSPDRIAYSTVMMMDWRKTDGLLAVGTFGAGVFTTKLTSLIDNTAIGEMPAERAIKIYPNPAREFLHIELGEANRKRLAYRIFALDGRLIKLGELEKPFTIDVSELNSGLYFLYTGNEQGVVTFVKE